MNDKQIIYSVPLGLLEAFESARYLQKPLLLIGPPGTGKTLFANYIAKELHKADNIKFKIDKPHVFNVKSDSKASDLFYTYDILTHFRDVNLSLRHETDGVETTKYIKYNALGLAIKDTIKSIDSTSSVVLIDEIDKGSENFLTDLYYELPNLTFQIKELGFEPVVKSPDQEVIIIIAGNFDSFFPEAFLRRCLCYFVDYHESGKLIEICENNVTEFDAKNTFIDIKKKLIPLLVSKFLELQHENLQKKPTTSELVEWLKLILKDLLKSYPHAKEPFQPSLLQIMLKNINAVVKLRVDHDYVRSLKIFKENIDED